MPKAVLWPHTNTIPFIKNADPREIGLVHPRLIESAELETRARIASSIFHVCI